MAEENVQAGAVGEQVGEQGAGAPAAEGGEQQASSGGAGQQQTDPVLARIQELEAQVAAAAELRSQFEASKTEWSAKEQLHQTEKTVKRHEI